LLLVCLLAPEAPAQTGHVVNGVGAVNQSMGGTGTGNPLDASSAIQWNPAAITGLKNSEVEFGFELLNPDSSIRSSVSRPFKMAGSTSSDTGISTIPSIGLVHHLAGTPWTLALGAFGIAGFGVDYPSDPKNPILNPAPMGFGSVFSDFQLLQLSPTVAYQIDEKWSVGLAPTIDQAHLAVDPFCGAPPDDANKDGFPTFPDAAHITDSWGWGYQTGVWYNDAESGWKAGASYKSEQDFAPFRWNSTDEAGRPRRVSLNLNFPSIASLGVGYSGLKSFDFAFDVRYIDYSHADGFGPAKFRKNLSVAGFGWDSIVVLAFGTQYKVTDDLWVRAGYAYNSNPIPDHNSTFNLPAPAIIQQHVSGGVSLKISKAAKVDLAYVHGFQNTVRGPIGHPTFGTLPGSSVSNTLSTDSIVLGFRVDF